MHQPRRVLRPSRRLGPLGLAQRGEERSPYFSIFAARRRGPRRARTSVRGRRTANSASVRSGNTTYAGTCSARAMLAAQRLQRCEQAASSAAEHHVGRGGRTRRGAGRPRRSVRASGRRPRFGTRGRQRATPSTSCLMPRQLSQPAALGCPRRDRRSSAARSARRQPVVVGVAAAPRRAWRAPPSGAGRAPPSRWATSAERTTAVAESRRRRRARSTSTNWRACSASSTGSALDRAAEPRRQRVEIDDRAGRRAACPPRARARAAARAPSDRSSARA